MLFYFRAESFLPLCAILPSLIGEFAQIKGFEKIIIIKHTMTYIKN